MMSTVEQSAQELLCPLRRRAGLIIQGFAVEKMVREGRSEGARRLGVEDVKAGITRLLSALVENPARLPKVPDIWELLPNPDMIAVVNDAKHIMDSFGYRFLDHVHEKLAHCGEGEDQPGRDVVVETIRATASEWLQRLPMDELEPFVLEGQQ